MGIVKRFYYYQSLVNDFTPTKVRANVAVLGSPKSQINDKGTFAEIDIDFKKAA
ncbi:MAG: hypothetical protein WA003_12615 [Desulfuromonadaceae bacterium]